MKTEKVHDILGIWSWRPAVFKLEDAARGEVYIRPTGGIEGKDRKVWEESNRISKMFK